MPYPRSRRLGVGRGEFGLDGTTISPLGVGGRLTLFWAEWRTQVAAETKTIRFTILAERGHTRPYAPIWVAALAGRCVEAVS